LSIWKSLQHENILPFLGCVQLPDASLVSVGFVSPWMDNGNCSEFLRRHPSTDRLPLIKGIINGLAYLHCHKPNPVIHGDMKADNILISGTGVPCLCDFGLSIVAEELRTMKLSDNMMSAGNPRWMAYELISAEDLDHSNVTTESDMWAFGMVLLEIFTGDFPFAHVNNEYAVSWKIKAGERPSRPGAGATTLGLSDDMWELMRSCWENDPSRRPTAKRALMMIDRIVS